MYLLWLVFTKSKAPPIDSTVPPHDKINAGHAWDLADFFSLSLYLTCKHRTVGNSLLLKFWIYTHLCIQIHKKYCMFCHSNASDRVGNTLFKYREGFVLRVEAMSIRERWWTAWSREEWKRCNGHCPNQAAAREQPGHQAANVLIVMKPGCKGRDVCVQVPSSTCWSCFSLDVNWCD